MEYHAIDGSQTIVTQLQERFPEYEHTIKCGDFTNKLPFEGEFDLIVDRASLTCNSTDSIVNAIKLIRKQLNVGGYFIGIDWYSDSSSDAVKGIRVDEFTRTNIEEGGFTNTGNVHFSSHDHIKDLFSDFEFISLQHKLLNNYLNKIDFGMWNFTVKNGI